MRLTTVVPATNCPPTLGRCVAAIEGADDPPEQLIVVEEPPGSGPASARNRGSLEAEGDVLVFVDADVIVHPDAFRRIRNAFAADPALDAVFGSYDDLPEDPGLVSGFRNLLHHAVHQSSPGPARTFWAGLGAVRREVFVAAGGFDAARFPVPSIEDVELGSRLFAQGARIELDPDLLGTHLKAWTLGGMLRTDVVRRGVPWVRLLLEGRVPTDVLNLGWRHRLSALAALAAAVGCLRRRPLAVVGSLALLMALNRSLYALLLRRRGPAATAAGVGLHALHHLAATLAVPIGALEHLLARRER